MVRGYEPCLMANNYCMAMNISIPQVALKRLLFLRKRFVIRIATTKLLNLRRLFVKLKRSASSLSSTKDYQRGVRNTDMMRYGCLHTK